jgi:hypothetical protein
VVAYQDQEHVRQGGAETAEVAQDVVTS